MAETGMVWTEDFEMGYCRFGFGNKTFVILPGLSVQSVIRAKEAVEASYAMMGGDFTTYLFDRKYEVSEGYTIYDMADDTAKAMKELGLKDVYLFGASQGGMIAMTIAIRYPELVKKLVLGNTSSHVKPEQRAVLPEIRTPENCIRISEKRSTLPKFMSSTGSTLTTWQRLSRKKIWRSSWSLQKRSKILTSQMRLRKLSALYLSSEHLTMRSLTVMLRWKLLKNWITGPTVRFICTTGTDMHPLIRLLTTGKECMTF